MNDLAEAVEQLTQNLEALERRVTALESERHAPASLVAAETVPVEPSTISPPQEKSPFSILGKSMLGIAGAYLLRALAESSGVARTPIVAVAIIYAFSWLIPSIRTKSRAARVAWACTSAVILLPMLWELTLRLALLPITITATVLAAFAVVASALSWKNRSAEVASVAAVGASAAAPALALATHNLVPILIALLFMTLASEIAAVRYRVFAMRWIVAGCADFVVFAFIWVYGSSQAVRADYPPVSASLFLILPLALLLISGVGACTQTLLLRQRISFAEITQTLVAFLLAVYAVMVFSPGPGARFVGMFCLVAAAVGYAVAFIIFLRASALRNFHVYATGGLLLLLAGCSLSFRPLSMQASFTCLAVVLTLLSLLTAHLTLGYHGLACLLAAAVSSHQMAWAAHAIADGFPVSCPVMIYFVSISTLFCGVAAFRVPAQSRGGRLLRLLDGGLALISAAALLVWMMVRIAAPGLAPTAEHLALLRTCTACLLTLALAWRGVHGRSRELIWLSWTALAFLAVKLLVEDLRHGHLGFAAASIFIFAITLLIVPHLQRAKISPARRAHL